MIRRRFLLGASGLLLLPAGPALATPAEVERAMAAVTGGRAPTPGRVKLDLPVIIENGNTVSLTVSVEPGEDTVRSIHIFADRNPLPNVAAFHFGPASGRPRVATRIRLATSGTVTAVAAMSDGAFWSDSVDLMVTLAACLE